MLIENLYEHRKKLEDFAKTKPLTAEQISFYGELCKRICSMERLKFLLDTAPKSMDPKKIHEHWMSVKTTINDIEPSPNEEIKELLKKGGGVFNSYKPTSVNSYSNGLTGFIKKFISLWNEKHNYK